VVHNEQNAAIPVLMESLRDILLVDIKAIVAGTLILMKLLSERFFYRMITDDAGTPEVFHQC